MFMLYINAVPLGVYFPLFIKLLLDCLSEKPGWAAYLRSCRRTLSRNKLVVFIDPLLFSHIIFGNYCYVMIFQTE